jgi:hypothetical protein
MIYYDWFFLTHFGSGTSALFARRKSGVKTD